MKTISTAELRKNIAKVLRFVEVTKRPVRITRYGHTVVTIVPGSAR